MFSSPAPAPLASPSISCIGLPLRWKIKDNIFKMKDKRQHSEVQGIKTTIFRNSISPHWQFLKVLSISLKPSSPHCPSSRPWVELEYGVVWAVLSCREVFEVLKRMGGSSCFVWSRCTKDMLIRIKIRRIIKSLCATGMPLQKSENDEKT